VAARKQDPAHAALSPVCVARGGHPLTNGLGRPAPTWQGGLGLLGRCGAAPALGLISHSAPSAPIGTLTRPSAGEGVCGSHREHSQPAKALHVLVLCGVSAGI